MGRQRLTRTAAWLRIPTTESRQYHGGMVTAMTLRAGLILVAPGAGLLSGCYLDVDYVRCDIGEADWSPPPRPADCEYDYGQGITIVPGGRAEFVCAGDTGLAPDGTALAYGQSISAGVLQCDSAESGITCRASTLGVASRSPARRIGCSDPLDTASGGFVPPRLLGLMLRFATGDDLARGTRM
jgi:hypothetical protein